jgi:hypothetical protein
VAAELVHSGGYYASLAAKQCAGLPPVAALRDEEYVSSVAAAE